VETTYKTTDFRYSLGLVLEKAGVLRDVIWEGPAFQAGLIPGTELIAVNGEAYDADVLKDAVKAAAKPGAAPLELLVKDGTRYRTVPLAYHDGMRYPHLERLPGTPDLLDAILSARK
jgi:predicted metalloprotease with PDZ domain